jgi:hypothetical protein
MCALLIALLWVQSLWSGVSWQFAADSDSRSRAFGEDHAPLAQSAPLVECARGRDSWSVATPASQSTRGGLSAAFSNPVTGPLARLVGLASVRLRHLRVGLHANVGQRPGAET